MSQKRAVAINISHISADDEDLLRGHLADYNPLAVASATGVLIRLEEASHLDGRWPATVQEVIDWAHAEGLDWIYLVEYAPQAEGLRLQREDA